MEEMRKKILYSKLFCGIDTTVLGLLLTAMPC